VDGNTSVKMLSPTLINTQVEVGVGRAMLEVDSIYPQNHIRVLEDGASIHILKRGLYDFDAAEHEFRVFDGKADVWAGDQKVTVKGGHELTLNSAVELKAKGFDKKALEDSDLYRWSSLRSSYLGPMLMPRAFTLAMVGTVLDGSGLGGIGIRGLLPTPGFQAKESSTARLAGVIIRGFSRRPLLQTSSPLRTILAIKERYLIRGLSQWRVHQTNNGKCANPKLSQRRGSPQYRAPYVGRYYHHFGVGYSPPYFAHGFRHARPAQVNGLRAPFEGAHAFQPAQRGPGMASGFAGPHGFGPRR
jgi:hypothetical protein